MSTAQEVEKLLEKQEQIEDEIVPMGDERALRRRAIRQVKKRSEFRTHLIVYAVMMAIFFVFFTALSIPWVAMVIALAWGSGLAAQGLDTYYNTGRRAAARLTRLQQAYRDAYGPRWYEDAAPEQLMEIHKAVDTPIRKHQEFNEHLVVFVCINLMLWGLYLAIMPGSFPWPLLVTGGWGLGLFGHATDVFSTRRSEQSIEREIERQRALLDEADWRGEKPKNDFQDEPESPAMTIGPDGELVELPPDEEPKRKYNM